jgi:hypothetical protein
VKLKIIKMKKYIKIFLIIILVFTSGMSNIANAQNINMYADATLGGQGFSYNVQLSITPLEYNNVLHAGGWVVKIISVNPDSKGYFHKGKTNRYFSCSELGSICNPSKFDQVLIKVKYQCANNAEKLISFYGNNREQTIVTRQEPNTKCSIQAEFVKVRTADDYLYHKRINEIEYPQQNTSTTNSNTSSSSSSNPVTQQSSSSTNVYINGKGNTSPSGSSKPKTQTNGGLPANTSGNDPLANYSNSGNVPESQGNAPVTNSTPNFESFSTPQVYTNPLSTYTKPSSGNANLDAFSQGYQRGQEISDAVLPAAQLGVDLWNAHVERKNAEYERERIAREAAEARRAEEARIAAIEKENKRILVSNRTKLINAYPDGKTPLSSEVKGATVIYFFVYSFDMSTIEGYKPKIYISNVFPLTKSGDGTWPYKTSLMDKITQANPGLKLVLSGYYLTEKEAIDSRDYLYVNSGNTVKFKVENIVYSNLKIETSKKSNTDFLGNPINSSKKETNTNEAKVDFLGNPIKK